MKFASTSQQRIADALIQAGLKQLRLQYPTAKKDTIITDRIFGAFFDAMLRETLGHSGSIDEVIHELRHEIQSHQPKEQAKLVTRVRGHALKTLTGKRVSGYVIERASVTCECGWFAGTDLKQDAKTLHAQHKAEKLAERQKE